jgi:hypothetical protein
MFFITLEDWLEPAIFFVCEILANCEKWEYFVTIFSFSEKDLQNFRKKRVFLEFLLSHLDSDLVW